jgi:xylonate dehydratase
VPEVLHLRRLNLPDVNALTVTGKTLDENLDWWEAADCRRCFRELLKQHDGVDPEEVIFSPAQAQARGLTSTLVFPPGNLASEGLL